METLGEKDEMKNVFEGVEYIKEEFFLSGGSGGQRRDRKKTAVRLRAKISDPQLIERLKELYPGAVTDEGKFLVEYQRESYQHQNRVRAYELLEKRMEEARREPKERIATKPTRASQKRWAETKKIQGEKKRKRQKPDISAE